MIWMKLSECLATSLSINKKKGRHDAVNCIEKIITDFSNKSPMTRRVSYLSSIRLCFSSTLTFEETSS